MKKLRSYLLVAVIILGINLPVLGATTFSDVSDTAWYYNNLLTLTSREIIDGFADGTFRPNNTLRLDQFIKLLVSTEDSSITLESSYWAYNYITYAFDNSILDDTYSSEIASSEYSQDINRYETIHLLANMFDESEMPYYYNELDLPFYDLPDFPEEYIEPLYKCYALGLISGYPDGEFKGTNTLKRSEATAIISRILYPQQRITPLTTEEVEARYSLLGMIATGELEDKTNVNDNLTLTEDTITYKTPYTSYPLKDIGLPYGQRVFINKLFTAWNNKVVAMDDPNAYLSTSINDSSFRMAFSSSESTETTILLSSNSDGDTILSLPYGLSLGYESSAYDLLAIMVEKYDITVEDQLITTMVTGYDAASMSPGYDHDSSIGLYTLNVSAGEDYVYITLSYPE